MGPESMYLGDDGELFSVVEIAGVEPVVLGEGDEAVYGWPTGLVALPRAREAVTAGRMDVRVHFTADPGQIRSEVHKAIAAVERFRLASRD